MHYGEGAFWRPLSEEVMIPLQVATGCTHNACKFCDMYHAPFQVSAREEVSADIDEIARTAQSHKRRIFLTGGNALALPTKALVSILEELREKLPGKPSVGSFARITDVARKSDDDLALLASLGMSDISIGSEGGYDSALKAMGKGFTSSDIVEQCARLDEAGPTYNLFLLLGMAGAGLCQKAARATVEVYDQTNPRRVMVHTMTAFADTPLRKEIDEGLFAPAGEIEMLEELRTFVSETSLHTYLLGNHIGNVARMNGFIPEQTPQMLDYIDHLIANVDEERLRRFRAHQRSI